MFNRRGFNSQSSNLERIAHKTDGNPNAQNDSDSFYQLAINAVKNNDQNAGEQIAYKICEAYGLSKDQMIQRAKQFFGIN